MPSNLGNAGRAIVDDTVPFGWFASQAGGATCVRLTGTYIYRPPVSGAAGAAHVVAQSPQLAGFAVVGSHRFTDGQRMDITYIGAQATTCTEGAVQRKQAPVTCF